MTTKQPRPIPNDQIPSWDIATRDLEKSYSGPVKDAVLTDIHERDVMGERKYGVRLQPFNGRDSLRDAYEEALDLTVYLLNGKTEGFPTYILYREALRMAVSIREMIFKRDGA
jgi:hypothetical protein